MKLRARRNALSRFRAKQKQIRRPAPSVASIRATMASIYRKDQARFERLADA